MPVPGDDFHDAELGALAGRVHTQVIGFRQVLAIMVGNVDGVTFHNPPLRGAAVHEPVLVAGPVVRRGPGVVVRHANPVRPVSVQPVDVVQLENAILMATSIATDGADGEVLAHNLAEVQVGSGVAIDVSDRLLGAVSSLLLLLHAAVCRFGHPVSHLALPLDIGVLAPEPGDHAIQADSRTLHRFADGAHRCAVTVLEGLALHVLGSNRHKGPLALVVGNLCAGVQLFGLRAVALGQVAVVDRGVVLQTVAQGQGDEDQQLLHCCGAVVAVRKQDNARNGLEPLRLVVEARASSTPHSSRGHTGD